MKLNKVFLSVLFFNVVLFLTSCYILEPDYFWHVKAGQVMFNNGILTHDIFSWVLNGYYWMSHEWLFEIILYIFKMLFGTYHVLVYSYICLFSLFFIIFTVNREKLSKNIFYTINYFVLVVTIYKDFIQARPYLLSLSFIALTVYLCLDLFKNEDSKKIYFLPLISILWANIHGGSSNLSYTFCLIFLICGLFKFSFRKIEATRLSKKQILKYIAVIVLCAVGICINIHGYKMLLYPYVNIMDTTMINYITEWQPTAIRGDVYHYIYFILILFIGATMLFSSKKTRFVDLMVFGFVTYLGLSSIRFWIFLPIVMSFIIFDYVKKKKVSTPTICVFSFLTFLILGVGIYNIKNINLEYKLELTDGVIKALKKEKPERLFNLYNNGGELIYHDIPVFIDGRADLYSGKNLQEFFDIVNLDDKFFGLMEKYDFDYYLLTKDTALGNFLLISSQHEIVYEDDYFVLFKTQKTVSE